MTGGRPLTATARRFWRGVWDGRYRLSAAEDALVWRMRAQGASWNRIAAAILMRRRRTGRVVLALYRRFGPEWNRQAAGRITAAVFP